MTDQIQQDEQWYKLDNSAKIYPAIVSDRQTTLFRITATLNEQIAPPLLQTALERLYNRFPYYNVSLRKGFFWNYLEKNNETPFIHHDTPSPCENINSIYYNGYLYKVLYYKKRIAVEFSHVLSDGYGALEFIKALVFEYLKLYGAPVQNDGSIMDVYADVDSSEISDDHSRYTASMSDETQKERNLFGGAKAFQIKGKMLPVDQYNAITGIIPIEDLKKISKSFDVTITEFLTAVYIESLSRIRKTQRNRSNVRRKIVIQVPVNMRNFLESSSMRNFSLFVTPFATPPVLDFNKLVNNVKIYMRKNAKPDNLMKIMKDNISVGENKWVRIVPLIIKQPIVRYIANTSGSTQYSGTLSNLGLFKLPSSMTEYVKEIECCLGPDPHSKTNCGAIGYNGNIFITFGRVIRESELERLFFTRLRKFGAAVKLRSNC